MFPLSNLARFGFEGSGAYAPLFWIAETGGQVTDVLTMTRGGTVMPFLPSGDIAAACRIVTGRAVSGIIGPTHQARPLADALRVNAADCTLNRDEPQFRLDLGKLTLPSGPGQLVPLQDMDRATSVRWRRDYHVEALGERPEDAAIGAEQDIARYIEMDSHRALIVDGTPVAMTGFNAILPEIVQIGGVYTPPEMRRRGHARRAVARHLAEARDRGTSMATLFSGNKHATRAYTSLGFEQIGHWTLITMREPRHV